MWAESRAALFAEALAAFTDTVTELEQLGVEESRRLEVRAPTLADLMVEWLEELLYRFETEGVLFRRATVEITEDEDGLALTAEARGEVFALDRHRLKILVKAVTYHRLAVERRGERWQARVIFDI